MKAITRLLVLGLVLLPATGCGRLLVGHWKGVEVSGGDKSKFAFPRMEFNEDRTFKGRATIDAERKLLAGTYRYDGFRLKLKTQEGLQTYWSFYNPFGRSLRLWHEGLKAKIERVGK